MASLTVNQKEQWQVWLEQWQQSGKSIAAWCKEQDIGVHKFQYWRNKLLPLLRKSSSHSLNKSNPCSEKFIELQDRPSKLSGISLEISSVKIYLAKDFDSGCLISCLQILRKL